MNGLYSIKIGGPAGFGIMSAGLSFCKFASRSGYSVYDYAEYPSIIRGGHNVMQIVWSDVQVRSPIKDVNLVIALDQMTIDLHCSEVVEGGGIVFDSDKSFVVDDQQGVKLYPVPLVKIAKDCGGSDLMRNTVALGVSLALLGGDIEILKKMLVEEFEHKGEDIVQENLKAVQGGFDFAQNNFLCNMDYLKCLENVKKQIVLNGNEAVALGAIGAGVQFASIYPMTPTSSILVPLAKYQKEYGFVYRQPEDEIAGINMALGASFAGARSLVATSGGGFCLMTEGLGLGGIAELPVVIIEGMRGAPATGLPTWTEQGDLKFVLSASHGDFPRIVLASSDAEDAFRLTMKAFDLADKYQTPVIVLVDKMICEGHQSFEVFSMSGYEVDRGKLIISKVDDYKRFENVDDGISPRSILGVGNHVIANSDEHDESGFSTEESEVRLRQMHKRMRKIETLINDEDLSPLFFGDENAPITIVSWGSNKGSILQAMDQYAHVEGKCPFNYIHLTWMSPFPTEILKTMLLKAQYLLSVEVNYGGQLASLVAEKTGIDILDKLLKYDGRPIYPEEVINKVNEIRSKL